MSIEQMLARFRPLYAADGEGGATEPAAPAAPPTAGADDTDFEVPEDLAADLEPPQAEEVEWEDLDIDDLKVRVPKGLTEKAKEALMRNADYTNKTKELARQRTEYEAREKALVERAQQDETLREGEFHLKNIDADLQKRYQYFQSREYSDLQEADPLEARRLYDRFQMDKDKRGELASILGQKLAERNSKAAADAEAEKQADAKRREQLPREIAKLVPGWNAEKQAKVEEFAVKLGYAPDAIKSTTDALHFKTLYLAEIGQRTLDSLARKGSGGVKPNPASPTKMVGQRGGATSGMPSDRQSIDEWMKAETAREQAARKARA